MSDINTSIQNATSVELSRDREQINQLIDSVLAIAEDQGFGASSIFAVRLAIEEAITNAFEHGHNGLDPTLTIHIEYAVDESEIKIAIQDQGPGFHPDSLPDPTLHENLSKPSGRGVMLMKAYMSHVVFNEQGNRVFMQYSMPR